MSNLLFNLVHKLKKAYWKIVKPQTLGVRAIILDESKEKVLLVRHTYIKGLYLPGGGVKKFETPESAIMRELKEEIGFIVKSCELFGVYSNYSEFKSDTVIVLICTGNMMGNTVSKEIQSFGFFDVFDLPDDVSPGTRRRIDEYLSGGLSVITKW